MQPMPPGFQQYRDGNEVFLTTYPLFVVCSGPGVPPHDTMPMAVGQRDAGMLPVFTDEDNAERFRDTQTPGSVVFQVDGPEVYMPILQEAKACGVKGVVFDLSKRGNVYPSTLIDDEIRVTADRMAGE